MILEEEAPTTTSTPTGADADAADAAAAPSRSGLRRFLRESSKMFEMTIYTAGTSQYADAVRACMI